MSLQSDLLCLAFEIGELPTRPIKKHYYVKWEEGGKTKQEGLYSKTEAVKAKRRIERYLDAYNLPKKVWFEPVDLIP